MTADYDALPTFELKVKNIHHCKVEKVFNADTKQVIRGKKGEYVLKECSAMRWRAANT